MVYRNNTGRLGFWLHQSVFRNTLAGSNTVVSISWNPTEYIYIYVYIQVYLYICHEWDCCDWEMVWLEQRYHCGHRLDFFHFHVPNGFGFCTIAKYPFPLRIDPNCQKKRGFHRKWTLTDGECRAAVPRNGRGRRLVELTKGCTSAGNTKGLPWWMQSYPHPWDTHHQFSIKNTTLNILILRADFPY